MFRSKLKRGFSRTAVAVAGLVLAFAMLSPASAPAETGGTDRPDEGHRHGNDQSQPGDGRLYRRSSRGSAAISGRSPSRSPGSARANADGTFAGSGTATIVAANGDELTGTITLTQTALPTGRTITTVVVTITGGTGRFADASGTLTVVCHSGPPALVGGMLLITAECKFTGQVSY